MKPATPATRPPSRSTCHALLLALLAAGLLAGTARAAVVYVSTAGSQTAPYDAWANAFTNLQNALDYAATNAGTTIYLAGGQTLSGPAYSTTAPSNTLFCWIGATNCTLSGGWDTSAAPPSVQTSPTILKRTTADSIRILTMLNCSNASISGVTIRGGNSTAASATSYGGGVFLSGCRSTVFRDSSIIGNTNLWGARNNVNYGRGGGMYLTDSTVTVTNSVISTNVAGAGESGYGGGIYVDNLATLTVRRSRVESNLALGSIYDQGSAYGGGFFVNSGGTLQFVETVIKGNGSFSTSSDFSSARYAGGGYNAGSLLMQNCLVVTNRSGGSTSDGFLLAAGAATFVNCTIADNWANGVVYNGGTVAMTNCIVWGHSSADLSGLPRNSDLVMPGVWYTCYGLSESQNNGWQGCLTNNPLFVDRNYYHLQSTVSNYTGSYFSGGTWSISASDSPAIDRGDPASDYSREPANANGRSRWINLGAYGNTEVASFSPLAAVVAPSVVNNGALKWGRTRALLRGSVTSTGGEMALTSFRYWPSSGATQSVSLGYQSVNAFSRTITGLTANTTYQYLVAASNSAGETLSSTASFVTHPTPSTFYVSTNGDNTAGTSWATAYNDLQFALDNNGNGDQNYLAGGQTLQSGIVGAAPAHPDNTVFKWSNVTNVLLSGGWDTGATPPVTRSGGATILRRTSGNLRILTMLNVSNALIEQVTIRDGYPQATPWAGGGVYIEGCSAVTFDSCSLVGNTSLWGSRPTPAKGGGMYLKSSTVTVTNSVISTNVSGAGEAANGGGVYVDNLATLTVRRSRVENNLALGSVWDQGSAYGGGFFVNSGGTLQFVETVIKGNGSFLNSSDFSSARYAGGGYNAGTLLMRNCLVVTNRSGGSTSDGFLLAGGAATFVNCTIADNWANGVVYNGGKVALTNCIIWGHMSADLTNFSASALSNVAYSIFATPGTQHGVNNCKTNNPLFASAISNNYRLLTRPIPSPAIDAGFSTLSGWMLSETDLAGARRRQHGRLDIGAYEATPSDGTVLLMW